MDRANVEKIIEEMRNTRYLGFFNILHRSLQRALYELNLKLADFSLTDMKICEFRYAVENRQIQEFLQRAKTANCYTRMINAITNAQEILDRSSRTLADIGLTDDAVEKLKKKVLQRQVLFELEAMYRSQTLVEFYRHRKIMWRALEQLGKPLYFFKGYSEKLIRNWEQRVKIWEEEKFRFEGYRVRWENRDKMVC